jgi:hypothetical protein
LFHDTQTEAALILDGLSIFVKGLEALNRSTELKTANLSCEKVIPWEHGPTLFNYMNSVSQKSFLSTQKIDLLYVKEATSYHSQY